MSSPRERTAVLVFAVAMAMAAVGISLSVKPDPRGYGTHEALGLPPCGLMLVAEVPCPSCGLTTSFAHSARLQVGSAFRANPAGPVLFGLVLATGGIALGALLRVIRPERVQSWYDRFPWEWGGVSLIVLLLLAWGWKVWEVWHAP